MNSDFKSYFFEDIKIGMTDTLTKTINENDILSFASVSGDLNPIHVDEEFAKTTRFKQRVAHGMLSASFISTVLGTRLPGLGSIYASQTLKFKAPVHIGDTVTVQVEVISMLPEKRRVTLATRCYVGETLVVDGEAVMLVNSKNNV